VEERLHHYLVVLVHESIHAILGLYSCVMPKWCRSHEKRVVSKYGHLGVWQEIAHAIKALSGEPLGKPFDLRLMESLGGDLVESRKPKIPSRVQLESWSLDLEELK